MAKCKFAYFHLFLNNTASRLNRPVIQLRSGWVLSCRCLLCFGAGAGMQDSAEAMGCSHTGVRRPPLLFWGYLSEANYQRRRHLWWHSYFVEFWWSYCLLLVVNAAWCFMLLSLVSCSKSQLPSSTVQHMQVYQTGVLLWYPAIPFLCYSRPPRYEQPGAWLTYLHFFTSSLKPSHFLLIPFGI